MCHTLQRKAATVPPTGDSEADWGASRGVAETGGWVGKPMQRGVEEGRRTERERDREAQLYVLSMH